MEKQLKLFTPSADELKGLDNVITQYPEMQELIEENDYCMERISEGVRGLKTMDRNTKDLVITFFRSLSLTHLKGEVYKITTFKNQEIIDKLMAREKEYRKIIKKQSEKHNDNQGIEEMEKMFSTMMIETKDNVKLSYYRRKTLNDIKFIDNFKPIFEKPGVSDYSKEELLQIKNSRKGPTFKDVEKLTVINVPEGNNIINGKVYKG